MPSGPLIVLRGDDELLADLDVLVSAAVLVAFLLAPALAWWTLRRGQALQRRVAALERRLALLEAPDSAAPEAEPAAPLDPAPVAKGRWRGLAALETAVAERWLVWLGAVALALGGLFLAGWAIDQGWLGARARIAAAATVGFVLLGLAERARDHRPSAATRPDAVPAALAAGGLSTLYGATLAAHLFYGLIGPGPGFALLALVSFCGIGLAMRFGPLVALVGTLGAYAAPLIVAMAAPAAWPLFLFLAVLAPPLVILARLTGWTWLLWLHLVGAISWQIGSVAVDQIGTAIGAPSLHLLIAGGSAVAALLPSRRWDESSTQRQRRPLALIVATSALLLLMHTVASGQPPVAIAALVALSALTIAVVALAEHPLWLGAMIAGIDLLAAVAWRFLPSDLYTSQWRDPSVGLEPILWIAPEAAPVAAALAVCAGAWAVVGAVLARRGRQPGFWAGLSVAVPLLALALAHVRLTGFAVSPGYSALALAMAALSLAGARWSAERAGQRPALAAYALGVVAALALGATLALEHAALTVTLAVLLSASAWISRRLTLAALRRVAWPLSLIVLARMMLDAELATLAQGYGPAFLIYACGVPAVCFWLAARWLARAPDDPLAALLQAGAVVAWLLLAAQLIAVTVRPAASGQGFDLAEAGLDATAWLATAWAMLRWWRREPQAWLPPLAAALLAAAAGSVVLGHNLLLANPVFTGEPVGDRPVLNLLLPAFALPAALAIAMARELRLLGRSLLANMEVIGGQALALIWITLEVRRAFQGSVMDGATSDGELLAWSAAWLGWAGMLLAIGIRTANRRLRATALAIASMALVKAFLFDLSELTGLYRAASFLALGLALIAVGWLYRRFVAAVWLSRTVARPARETAGWSCSPATP